MPKHPAEDLLKPGDILITRIPNFLYRRVADATGSLASHVGIAFYDPDQGWLVAESAVPRVRYSTLASFIARSEHGWLVVRRLHGGLSLGQVQALRAACDARMGKLYHLGFHYLSARQFCSKFVHEVYLSAIGVEVGKLETFQSLLSSQPDTPLWFWRLWFLGRIPWTRLTITPASQLRCGQLETIWESPCFLNPK
ncbi:MAG: YiiX/YebB-like N1pC/P60 family cysteine hydrolase [Methylococcales bacterium]|nr:YiiX/YebB-like N1pC/P60 family cysteine hydrolase [Methylococcales bacterium]